MRNRSRPPELAGASVPLKSFVINFLWDFFEMPDDLLVLSKLVTKLLLLILNPLVKVRDKVIEVILPLEMGLSHLMNTHWSHLISSSQSFPGVGSLTFQVSLGPLTIRSFLPDGTGF